MLIPHEPVAYVSNLIPMLHAHFVISTLERAGAEARALKRVAPGAADDEIAKTPPTNEAPKRAAAGDAAPNEVTGIDAPRPGADASAEPSKPAPLGATPAGRRYLWPHLPLSVLLDSGHGLLLHAPTFWFVSEVLKIKSSCTWKVKKGINTWQERACDRPCEEIPGCGDGWCDVMKASASKSTSDDRCVGKADRFELGHDEWCEAGLRVHECEEEACDPPCEERPGCSTGWCRDDGRCYMSFSSDDICDGKENGFDLGYGEYCYDGLRNHACKECDPPCEDRPGCDGPDFVICAMGSRCITGTVDDVGWKGVGRQLVV